MSVASRGQLQSQILRGFLVGPHVRSSQRPRACRTGSSTEAVACIETPAAPMLVSQQSNPQPARACLVASTLARSRPGEGRQLALVGGTQQTAPTLE